MNRLLPAIIALGFVFSMSSCSLWRRVTGRQKPQVIDSMLAAPPDSMGIRPDTGIARMDTPAVMPPALPDSADAALLQAWLPLWNARTAYATFSGKAKVHYEGAGDEKDFSISIQMERDKRIWISITGSFLGLSMEAVRALITPDTIVVINRLQKEVSSLPFAEAGKLLPVNVDFATLQSLIIGDVLPAGHVPDQVADTSNMLILTASSPDFDHVVQYSKPDTTLRFQHFRSAAASLLVDYAGYEMANGHRFARDRRMMMQNQGELHHLTLEFSQVSFDEPVNMNFSIPAKYERK
jgi:hypothetical protein